MNSCGAQPSRDYCGSYRLESCAGRRGSGKGSDDTESCDRRSSYVIQGGVAPKGVRYCKSILSVIIRLMTVPHSIKVTVGGHVL